MWENISDEYTVEEVNNMFNGLQLEEREPDELWNDIREIIKYTADKKLTTAKRKKVSRWLPDEAVYIADEPRKARNQGDDDKCRRMETIESYCIQLVS